MPTKRIPLTALWAALTLTELGAVPPVGTPPVTKKAPEAPHGPTTVTWTLADSPEPVRDAVTRTIGDGVILKIERINAPAAQAADGTESYRVVFKIPGGTRDLRVSPAGHVLGTEDSAGNR